MKITFDQIATIVQVIGFIAMFLFTMYKTYKAKGVAGVIKQGEQWLPTLLRTLEVSFGAGTGAEKIEAAKNFIIDNGLSLPNTNLTPGEDGYEGALTAAIEQALVQAKKDWGQS